MRQPTPILISYCPEMNSVPRWLRSWIILLTLLVVRPIESAIADQVTAEEITALFQYCTREVPPVYTMTALVLTESPAWTEQQINEMVRQQEAFGEKNEKHQSKQDREKLRKARIDGIRKAHSGKRWTLLREFRDGSSYRLDQSERYSEQPLADELSKLSNLSFNQTFVNVAEGSKESREGIKEFVFDYKLQAARANATPGAAWARADLWQAIICEPKIAILVVGSLVDPASISPVRLKSNINGSFAGVGLSEARARGLIAGNNENWTIERVATVQNAEPAVKFTWKGKAKSSVAGAVAKLTMDPSFKKLYAYEMTSGSSNFRVTRSRFNDAGIPTEWSTESTGIDGTYERKTVTVLAYETQLPDDKLRLFAYAFPTNWTASTIENGKSSLTQNPVGGRVFDNSGGSLFPYKKVLWGILFIAVFAAPLGIKLWRRVPR